MDEPSKWEARFLAEARRATIRELQMRRRLVVFLGLLTFAGLTGFLGAVVREHWPPDASLITPILLGVAVLVYCASSFQSIGLLQGAIEHLRHKAAP